AAARFYDEPVEADAVHEQVVRREVVGGLLAREPGLDADIAFGVGATGLPETRLTERLLTNWRAGDSALRPAVPRRGGAEPGVPMRKDSHEATRPPVRCSPPVPPHLTRWI
ncbi:iron-containing redox enzyme family protein, partial [Streptomyces sp. A475]|uniref:iron-containing redox enzyme family protein n=1 Tax=Streptomyces sp. A475 TaxID=3131976 RepID=UPI0030C92EA1